MTQRMAGLFPGVGGEPLTPGGILSAACWDEPYNRPTRPVAQSGGTTMFRYALVGIVLATLSGAPGAGQKRPAAAEPAKKAKAPRTVAILIFDGVELLDFTGPAEVFIVA